MRTAKHEVYFNLHKQCLSVRLRGKVVGHFDSLAMVDAKFVVGQAGRERVLSEKRKNVHAFVRGDVSVHDQLDESTGTVVTYNPYKYNTFVTAEGELPVRGAKKVSIRGKKVVAWGLEYIKTFPKYA